MRIFVLLLSLSTVLLAACNQGAAPEGSTPEELEALFGTTGSDRAYGLASHSTGVYVVGSTSGNLHGTNAGKRDAFIQRYSLYGTLLWGRQFGGEYSDGINDAATDLSDNAYVVGYLDNHVAFAATPWCCDKSHPGDAFLRKYTPSGGVAWTRRISSSGDDEATGVAVYGDSIYIVGRYGDGQPIFSKYNANGTLIWRRHFSSTEKVSLWDVAVDGSGNVYLAGTIWRTTNDADMFIRKVNANGGTIWTQQVKLSTSDYGRAVAVSADSVYLVGEYLWADDTKDRNVHVTKYRLDGRRVWSNAYGHYGQDHVASANIDSNGDLYIAGHTYTSFAGTRQGGGDGYVLKLSYTGLTAPLWSKTVATSSYDEVNAVLARPNNELYVAGSINGKLPYMSYVGNGDAFLRRLYRSSGETVWTK